MEDVFHLDLQTLIAMLAKRSATLWADIPKIAGINGPCRAIVKLVHGQVMHCVIQNRQGDSILIGNDAFRALESWKTWYVVFENLLQQQSAVSATPPSGYLPSGQDAYVPRRLTNLTSEFLLPFTPKQRVQIRVVYTTIDGYKTIGQLKAQLNLSAETIQVVLDLLYREQLIVW